MFLLEDRRTIHNLIYTVITTVKGSKEPLPWIKVNPLDLSIGLCADLLINGMCGSVYELFYYSWLFVSLVIIVNQNHDCLKYRSVTLPVFLLEDRRTIHNLIYTVITSVKRSKEPLPWKNVNPLDLSIGLCADLLINGMCGSVYELFYYSWLFVFFFVCLVFWLGTKLAFLQCTVGMTTIWTTNKHKTLRLGWIKLTREHA